MLIFNVSLSCYYTVAGCLYDNVLHIVQSYICMTDPSNINAVWKVWALKAV